MKIIKGTPRQQMQFSGLNQLIAAVNPVRIIHRSEYQDAVDRNNENIRNNPGYYKRRQSICEHPFGTIKRQWGYTYTLMKD